MPGSCPLIQSIISETSLVLCRYSFNFGSAHFVSVNTETDYPDAPNDKFSIGGVGNGGFGDQLRWLEEDLRVRA